MKVGVFDSGIGGLSVAKAIKKALPELEISFKNDPDHVPYGSRQPDAIFRFIEPIFQSFIDEGCQVIVVACNTVTTTLISRLRERFEVPLVAVEPMVKPAAKLTKTGVIAVCATPTTLASARYAELKRDYAADVTVIEPDCSDWTRMIEAGEVDQAHIAERINSALEQNADVIVLGCTHYHWIEAEIKTLAGNRATVMQPESALIRQLQRVLAPLS
ncbi:MAG: putative Glutamate racemase [Candidatus Saccharibacteria bacterium]|nr:putative Glutamate racemase [Candidatus Saccharibacteria bacterium]